MSCLANDANSKSNRRRFLQTTGAAAAVFGLPNVIVGQKTDTALAIVGDGEYQFECHHDWGTLPSGHAYGGATHGVAVDGSGLIYITHHGNPGSIFVFDSEGKFVRAMGEQLEVGHGIDIRKEGSEEFIYVSPDTPVHGFAKLTLRGEMVWQKDRQQIAKDSGLYEGDKSPFRATNVNFTPDGGYFLGDGYGSGYIHRYDKQDKYLGSFGGSGDTDGKFQTPHGQWLDERDGSAKVVVCDRANRRLQYFDLEGNYLSKLEGFLFPADIDIQGDLMLVPDLHARVTILDKENQVVTHLGDDEGWRQQVLSDNFKMRGQRERWKSGRFIHPHDACFDKDGDIFVAEWVKTGRVTKLTKV